MSLARAPAAIAARGIALGAPLILAEETRSTNDDAKQGARAGAPHGAVWLAESQTAGRGRQGRPWFSPPGESLLFSVLLRLHCAPARVPPVSLVAGLAVRDAVARALGASPGSRADERVVVKWPNDVLVRSARDGVLRKVAGVLVESALAGSKVEHVVVGIGLNVLTPVMPEELELIATSIAIERAAMAAAERATGAGAAPGAGGGEEAAREIDRAEILADVLAGLDRDAALVAHKGLGHVHARLARHDALLGREVESAELGTTLRGTACGIDPEGRLMVRSAEGGITRVSSGELRIRAVGP